MPKASAENFTVASLLLPPSQRRALLGIYGFARLVDDAGDEAPGDRKALLDWIEDDVGRMFASRPIHPLLRRLAPSAREFGFPKRPFLRLIAANRQDQEISRYQTYDQLAAYCDLSANPIGELVLHVFRAATRERVHRSDAVCTGLQLAEHWQDVGEDFRRGRVYLPLEDMERFGVGDDDLAGTQPSDSLQQLLAFEVERARRHARGKIGGTFLWLDAGLCSIKQRRVSPLFDIPANQGLDEGTCKPAEECEDARTHRIPALNH